MSRSNKPERGQILVLFGLLLVGMVAMVGLVIDGGATYAMRRGEQKAADLAALAGADALINPGGDWNAAAVAVATANGYTAGTNTTVTVTHDAAASTVKVDITAPHRNGFAGIIPGQATWLVTVTATAQVSVPYEVLGGDAPIIFSDGVFDPSTGQPYAAYTSPTDFTKTKGSGSDAPLATLNMAWTNLGTGSVNSAEVKAVLDGSSPINASVVMNEYIGQANNGVKNTLFDDPSGKLDSVQTALAGKDVVVPIVGGPIAPATSCVDAAGNPEGHTNGCFHGWALFHVVSAAKNGGGEDGTVTGYFVSGITRSASSEHVCTQADLTKCPGFHGLYSLKLIN